MKTESKALKSFNQWMNEDVTNAAGTKPRYDAFELHNQLPHPITLAEHVWQKCAENFALRVDQVLTRILLMSPDLRAVKEIKEFKEEIVKIMISNSVGFTPNTNPISPEGLTGKFDEDFGEIIKTNTLKEAYEQNCLGSKLPDRFHIVD